MNNHPRQHTKYTILLWQTSCCIFILCYVYVFLVYLLYVFVRWVCACVCKRQYIPRNQKNAHNSNTLKIKNKKKETPTHHPITHKQNKNQYLWSPFGPLGFPSPFLPSYLLPPSTGKCQSELWMNHSFAFPYTSIYIFPIYIFSYIYIYCLGYIWISIYISLSNKSYNCIWLYIFTKL